MKQVRFKGVKKAYDEMIAWASRLADRREMCYIIVLDKNNNLEIIFLEARDFEFVEKVRCYHKVSRGLQCEVFYGMYRVPTYSQFRYKILQTFSKY